MQFLRIQLGLNLAMKRLRVLQALENMELHFAGNDLRELKPHECSGCLA